MMIIALVVLTMVGLVLRGPSVDDATHNPPNIFRMK